MPIDTKKVIAEAARTLLLDKNRTRLTVKDIVEECQITRKTFYYHFESIPALFRWILEKDVKIFLQEVLAMEDAEQGLRYFFLLAINSSPYVKKSMQTNYRDEFQDLLLQYVYEFFEQLIEQEKLYQNCTHSQVKLFLRYHSNAVIGLLLDWTEEDTKNLDQIVHSIYLLMTGAISP